MEITADGRFLNLFLYNGSSYIEVSDKKQKAPFRITNFKENLIRFNLSSFNAFSDSEKLYKGHYAMLNNEQLNYSIDSLKIRYKNKVSSIRENILSEYLKNVSIDPINKVILASDTNAIYDIAINKLRKLKAQAKSNKNDLNYQNIIINKHKIEWHRKISLAIACLLLFLVGAPLGSIIRKGGFGLPVLFSVMFFLLFHILNMIGEKSAKDLSLTPFEGMWLANFVFIPIIFFLLYKATNESKFIDLSPLHIFINRIKKKIQ
jgi:lipopolysaccharide export system permease protein